MVSGPFSYGVQNLQMFPVTEISWRNMANDAVATRGHGFEFKNLRAGYAVAFIKRICCILEKNVTFSVLPQINECLFLVETMHFTCYETQKQMAWVPHKFLCGHCEDHVLCPKVLPPLWHCRTMTITKSAKQMLGTVAHPGQNTCAVSMASEVPSVH